MADLVPESEQQYGSILTVLGESAEQNGKMLKKPVEFTHIAFGDANDTYVQPDRKSQSLVNELYRIPVNSVDVLQATPDSVPILTVEALLPDDIHDVVIREFAAVATFNGQEYFHAIGNCARIYVPSPINNGQLNNPVSLEMTFVITSAEPIVLINPNVITASRNYVNTQVSKSDERVAQAIIDQNGKDWFIEDGFLVTPSGSAYNIKAGGGYVSGNRVAMEFDRSVQVPNKPSFIYVDAHREGTPTGEQVTLFDFVITAEEKDDYIDSSTGKDVKHFVCKIAQVHADGSVSDLRPESPIDKRWETGKQVKANKDQYLYLGTEQCVYGKRWYAPRASGEHVVVMGGSPLDNGEFREVETGALALSIGDSKEIAIPEGVNCTLVDNVLLYQWDDFSNESHTIQSVSANAFKGYDVVTDKGTFEFVSKAVMDLRGGSTKLSNRVNSVLSGWGNLGTVAQNTLTLQNAINNSNKITILEPVAVSQINLKSDFELHFAGAGKLIGQSGSKVIYAESVTNTKVNNPVIEGVYDGDTSNLAEHAIEFKYSSNIEINNPKGRNIGGCFIRVEECTDILTRNVDAELVGYLAYIAVDCVRAKLKGGRGSKIDDPYAFQSKGGASDEIYDVNVFGPNSCGVIFNTNNKSGKISDGCKTGNIKVYGDHKNAPASGTKGAVFFQGINGLVGTTEIRKNTKIPQLGIGGGTDNLQVTTITLDDNVSLGIDIWEGVKTVVINSLIAKGAQDRALRARSGRIYINGGDIVDNGKADVPNIEFIDWEDFIISGVGFKQSAAGQAKNNIKLGASTGKGLITGNQFDRNSAPDVKTATGEFRVDCPNVEVHGNNDCYVQVTDGWVDRFEIKDGLIVPSGYARGNAPTDGNWVVGDTIRYSNIAIGSHSEFVCVDAEPGAPVFGKKGIIS
ncbi:phage tail-collar fiber domain-containing protein [Vibrio vulnificus]|uniref:phage tail-collar fiber domain-containing protein n=1 Tax=Vibrio vulnificus TaxID=672 RepID=UPI003ED9BC3A